MKKRDAPLKVVVKDSHLVISIGISTLAFAAEEGPFTEYNPDLAENEEYTGTAYEKIATVTDAKEFAKDVVYAMLREDDEGSTPLSRFLDAMAVAASEDGSIGLSYPGQKPE